MTICVAVKVHDCLVFAADSALSLVEGGETVNVYAHGNKVFNVVKGLPVPGMKDLSGLGVSITTLVSLTWRRIMSDKAEKRLSKTLLPDLPRDVPMPKYRYQEDHETIKKTDDARDGEKRAAMPLAGTGVFGCAASEKTRSA